MRRRLERVFFELFYQRIRGPAGPVLTWRTKNSWSATLATRELPTRIEFDQLLITAPSVSCDVCHRHGIPGVRIVCLDCPRSDHGLVNFCPTIRCSLSQITLSTRTDLPRPHTPVHSLLRIPYVMHLGMEASVLERARAGIVRAGKVLDGEKRGVRRDENALRRALPARKSQASRPRCGICKRDVMTSCWYCVDCQGKETSISMFGIAITS